MNEHYIYLGKQNRLSGATSYVVVWMKKNEEVRQENRQMQAELLTLARAEPKGWKVAK